MSLPIQAVMPPLVESEKGVVRIRGTRIPLERVVDQFMQGSTPEQIVQDFDTLALKDVYTVIAYYLHNRAEVDAYMAAAEEEEERIRQEIEKKCDPTGIRARLLARRAAQAG
jgi:uncharacterized protein (DUF433 family)